MSGYREDNHVKTYDPHYVIVHSDSSDFQDLPPRNANDIGTRKVDINRAEKEYSNQQLKRTTARKPNKKTSTRNQNEQSYISQCHHCGDPVPQSTETSDLLDPYPNQVPSRTNLLKKRLSNIFCSDKKKMNSIYENNCQLNRKVYCDSCRQRQIKKLQRKQLEQVARPVYLVEDMPAVPLDPPAGSERYRQLPKIHSQLSCFSSNSDTELRERKQYKCRREIGLDKEIKKEYLKYRMKMEKLLKQHPQVLQPYSIPKYHVLASYRSRTHHENNTDSLPTAASVFWNFFFDKITAKYQEVKSLSSSAGAISGNSGAQTKKSDRHQECQASLTIGSQMLSPRSQQFHSFNGVTTSPEYSQLSEVISPMKSSPMSVTRGNHGYYKNNVSAMSTQASLDYKIDHQEPHDFLTRALAKTYNGEVLCIHNPPCVLINGCLNVKESMPQSFNTQSVKAWPVITPEKKPGYLASRKLKKSKKKYVEQACQHLPQFAELQQYQLKSEKFIQSICNHNPPCKIVPGCVRPQYDRQLDISCVHVPICDTVPECLIETELYSSGYVCDHSPRCLDVPKCHGVACQHSRGDVCTQVRPKITYACKHLPPCLMIPSCLARLMCGSTSALGGAIPDCTHRPPCELIPACCRKLAKDTVSVCSQYPNGCLLS